MCNFFSFVGDGFGNYKYYDWAMRLKLLVERSKDLPDSHTRILTYYEVPPKMQDRWSKYEYNPLTKQFSVDQEVEGHNHEDAKSFVEKLDFRSIVAPLIIKDIVHPFKLHKRHPSKKDLEALARWASVRESVRESVWNSVGASVRDSVGASVRDSMGASVGDSVWDSVLNSVWDSVWTSVQDSLWAYISSFFDITYPHDYSSPVYLWGRGFIPSFGGEVWRLHSGAKAEIVYTQNI